MHRRPVSCAVLLLLASLFAAAQSVSELALQSDAQQRAAIMTVVNTSVGNLRATTERDGKPKSDADYQLQRAMGNMVGVFFTANPRHPEDDPPGFKPILSRIQKGAKNNPNQTLIELMGDFVDATFKRFYMTPLKPESKAIWATKTDSDQVELFRASIQMYLNERAYERVLKEFDAEEARLSQKMKEMEENTVLLPDGRSIFRDKNGDLWAVAPGSSAQGTKLQGKERDLAERLATCKARRGIKNGREALDACRQEVGLKP